MIVGIPINYNNMDYDIIDELDEPTNQALIQLAKRKTPEAYDWIKIHSWTNEEPTNAYSIRCLICDERFPNMPGVNRHGMKHLKDLNLLPFL